MYGNLKLHIAKFMFSHFAGVAGCTLLLITISCRHTSWETCVSIPVILFLRLQSEADVSILFDVKPIRRITATECHGRLNLLTFPVFLSPNRSLHFISHPSVYNTYRRNYTEKQKFHYIKDRYLPSASSRQGAGIV
jgi:hypothetical protein